jgi:hypothetical protein
MYIYWTKFKHFTIPSLVRFEHLQCVFLHYLVLFISGPDRWKPTDDVTPLCPRLYAAVNIASIAAGHECRGGGTAYLHSGIWRACRGGGEATGR